MLFESLVVNAKCSFALIRDFKRLTPRVKIGRIVYCNVMKANALFED